MLYIVSSLVTEGQNNTFSLIGVSSEKKTAASLAAAVYKNYNKNASFQNVEMITEWLATRLKHSFRRNKEHRLQLAITPVDGESIPADKQVVFSAQTEQDELMRKVSEALFEGKHSASRPGSKPMPTCPLES